MDRQRVAAGISALSPVTGAGPFESNMVTSAGGRR